MGLYIIVAVARAGRRGRRDAGVLLAGLALLGTVLLANLPDFWELKRTRTAAPDMDSVPAAITTRLPSCSTSRSRAWSGACSSGGPRRARPSRYDLRGLRPLRDASRSYSQLGRIPSSRPAIAICHGITA